MAELKSSFSQVAIDASLDLQPGEHQISEKLKVVVHPDGSATVLSGPYESKNTASIITVVEMNL